MENFAFYSYAISTLAFFILFCLVLVQVRKNSLAFPTAIALFFSIVWGVYILVVLQNDRFYIQETLPLESIRNLAWFFLLSTLISKQQFNKPYLLLQNSSKFPFLFLFTICVAIIESYSGLRYQLQELIGFDLRLYFHIGFSIIGLMLVEQLYRNATQEQRWSIKYCCLGLAALFTIDFILYSKSLLFKILDTSLWEARGLVNALTAIFLAISLSRLSQKQIKINVSNKVIFHTTVLLGAGFYLLLMSLAGYFIKEYGGSWGTIAQISFIFLAIIFLLVFFVSGKIRALAKVYFGKHLFKHRYDYRDEWVILSKKIAEINTFDELSNLIIRTMADIVDSSGGGLWVKNDQGDFFLCIENNLGEHQLLVKKNELLIEFINEKQWVIDFVEYFNDPDIYAGAGLDVWYSELKDIWLIIPLFQQNILEAFVVLAQPRVPRQIDWEDHDLLKTVGMQLANALALAQASDDLIRARQFEAYNRFSAFLVHDLKNLVAQIALIVKNSHKHKRNPEFIDDSIETLENVVVKIEQILGQLKKGSGLPKKQLRISLKKVIEDVALQQALNKPRLKITIETDFWVLGEKEKMTAILGHLVQNAQEATEESGTVEIEVYKDNNEVVIMISDTGCGMDDKFIQQRLFKPFDTTKGNAGMGIGVYEAQEYILQQSGHITVKSKIGLGTTFTINLPEANTLP